MTYQVSAFTVAYGIATLIAIAAAFVAWRRRSAAGGRWLVPMLFSIIIWCAADMMEITAIPISGHEFWSRIGYLGSTTSSVFLLLFVLEFTGLEIPAPSRLVPALLAVPALGVIAVFTNDRHHLIWTGFEYASRGRNILTYHHGPLYWVVTAYGFLLAAVATVLLLRFAIRRRGLFRYQSVAIVVAVIVPWAALIAYNFFPSFWFGVDPGIAFVVTGVMLSVGLVRFRLLDLVPVAREFVMEQMAEGLLVVDGAGRIADANPAARRLLALGGVDVIGKTVVSLLKDWPELALRLVAEQPAEEFTVSGPLGVVLSARVNALGAGAENYAGNLAILRDVTEQCRAEEALQRVNEDLTARVKEIEALHEELREQAFRDPLTQLYNRRLLLSALQRELGRASREEYPVSLVMLDVDHFKAVNDTGGHTCGDAVLRALAGLLSSTARLGDMVFRYGGDEFLILMPNCAPENAGRRADEWRHMFEVTAEGIVGENVRPTLSLGVASFPQAGKLPEEVLTAADGAAYAAKRAGRNCVRLYETGL